MPQTKNIYVYIDWQYLDAPVFMGVLSGDLLRGKEVFSYENDPEWLKCREFRALDPDLGNFISKLLRPNMVFLALSKS